MVFNPVLKTCDSPRNFACREHPAAPATEPRNFACREHPAAPATEHGRDQGQENGAGPSQLSSSISGKQCLNVFGFGFLGLFTCLQKNTDKI